MNKNAHNAYELYIVNKNAHNAYELYIVNNTFLGSVHHYYGTIIRGGQLLAGLMVGVIVKPGLYLCLN